MFNAFVKVIPNFYSCKANVEKTKQQIMPSVKFCKQNHMNTHLFEV